MRREKRMQRKGKLEGGILIFLLLFSGLLLGQIQRKLATDCFPVPVLESEAFRQLKLSPENYKKLLERCDGQRQRMGRETAAAMVAADFDLSEKMLPDKGQCERTERLLLRFCGEEYRKLQGAYQALLAEQLVFPIPEREGEKEEIGYEDSFLAPRTYGGNRSHEGTDLFGAVALRGYYPVLSVSEGTVEQVGWLPLGGYRIGIRQTRGLYYYYAHLDSYARKWKEGDTVQAGELLGFLGDSGYGEEGTKGQFPPHLHFGVYLKTEEKEELSVDPYWLLKTAEKNKRKYAY